MTKPYENFKKRPRVSEKGIDAVAISGDAVHRYQAALKFIRRKARQAADYGELLLLFLPEAGAGQ